jgi:hypothetical protein
VNVVNVVNVARGYRPGISFCNLNKAQYLRALAASLANAYRKPHLVQDKASVNPRRKSLTVHLTKLAQLGGYIRQPGTW